MQKMNKLTIDDISLQGKRVLVRVDFNVPLNERGNITEESRISAALPTIQKIVKDGGRAILVSHLGRPDGKIVESMRLVPVAKRLSELLGEPVKMAPDCIGPAVEKMAAELKDGEILMLENLRFYNGETDNDPEFAKKLASYGDVFINDAFGTAHRAHASTEGITHYFKQNAAGYLLQKEIQYLSTVLEEPHRPFVAIIGGAKISGKIDVMANLLNKVNTLLIGGGMMYTFLKAKGLEIGDSLLEPDKVSVAEKTMKKAGTKLVLPVDCIIADNVSETAKTQVVSVEKIPIGWKGVDIGPETIRLYYGYIIKAQTIIWNGPMGIFEIAPFAKGTNEIAHAIADATKSGAVSVVGGGDTDAAVTKAGYDSDVTHISTGGGASLEMLEGKVLPGVAALTDK
jgi:phosphoglycerate kinase